VLCTWGFFRYKRLSGVVRLSQGEIKQKAALEPALMVTPSFKALGCIKYLLLPYV